MGARENDNRSESLKFNGKEIQLAVKMLDNLETTIDIMYYLMENENQQAFVLMLLTANDVDLNTLLDKEKRETDILFEIDKEESLYVMLCQDTKVDGGYRFAERLLRNIELDKGTDIYCTEVEVRATHYTPKQVILKLLETFVKSKVSNKSNEIVFRSLN
ncbi:hypothetical protein TSL6_10030 [Sulfurovum sp. TSL6]|uniref:hypothetical protein n=1 Tax=Sulfurovum sp. TSL6 TaxID=2826995 RepID=UPI001CC427B2|nr:hypothetical protein [Sulfurovum sp. TSL6]GIU00497.1 hypothetical protein TSL6_10030 [Sulfurovum sp. TSL6]